MPIGVLVQSMTQWELTHWLALQDLYPSGEKRADMRMAIQTAALVNIHLPKKSKGVKPEDYMVQTMLEKEAAKKLRGSSSGFDKKAFFARIESIAVKST